MNMIRKTLKDWKLSDGTHIPVDSFIAIANHAMHKDEVRILYIHVVKHGMTNELIRRNSPTPTHLKHSDSQRCVTETESWIA